MDLEEPAWMLAYQYMARLTQVWPICGTVSKNDSFLSITKDTQYKRYIFYEL